MPTIEVNFSSSGMRKLTKELEKYQRKIDSRVVTFVNQLATLGIKVGKENRGEYGNLITFTKKVSTSNDGATAIITVSDEEIAKTWWYKDEYRYDWINPLLMAEFGSGKFANIANVEYVGVVGGQGTLNTYGHAYDEDGWWWTTLDGVTHHSYGEKPTYPVYSAYMEIVSQINNVAKEVFK